MIRDPQTVTVPLHGTLHVVALPFDLPSTGVIHVGATWTDDEGSNNLRGASVTIDGERRGVTPLTLDLPRGPHSLRSEYRGEELPVQVIDLPGGNERFASFSFGMGTAYPSLVLQSSVRGGAPDASTPVRVLLKGLSVRDVREVWLHGRAQDGSWRRYPMAVTNGDWGAVATLGFPASLVDARGDARFYVSALLLTGEEYFTDILGGGARGSSRSVRREPAAKPALSRSDKRSADMSLKPVPVEAPQTRTTEGQAAPSNPPLEPGSTPSTP